MNMFRKLAGIGAATALAAITVAVVAPQASAATYNGACGTGYTVIDHMNVGGFQDEATTYLTYNNGWDCVVTITNTPGPKQYLLAEIELSGGTWQEDEGNYSVYAGPEYVYAPHHCIDWGGWAEFSGESDIVWNDHCS